MTHDECQGTLSKDKLGKGARLNDKRLEIRDKINEDTQVKRD